MIFDAGDYRRLATLFGDSACRKCDGQTIVYGCAWQCENCGRSFDGQSWPPVFKPYPGYRPNVLEAPNGDTKPCPECFRGDQDSPCRTCAGTGRVPNVDRTKRFLHVALKYNPPAWALEYLARAHFETCRVAETLGVPAAYYPRVADTTLRVLEYPAGAGSAEHTDFDLFTILCWRETPEDLERKSAGEYYYTDCRLLDSVAPGLHIGEIGELVGLGPATPHRVPPRPYVQRSIVAFAMPDHEARLPCSARYQGAMLEAHKASCVGPGCKWGPTVGEWLAERLKRSRVYT